MRLKHPSVTCRSFPRTMRSSLTEAHSSGYRRFMVYSMVFVSFLPPVDCLDLLHSSMFPRDHSWDPIFGVLEVWYL
jgi:hypothetical protein